MTRVLNHIPDDRLQRVQALGYDYAAQPKERIDSCNLCGENYQTILTHVDRYGYPATTAACNICGLTFLNPIMTGEAYGEFYTSIYRPLVSAYHGQLINAQTIQDEQLNYARDLAKFIHPWIANRSVETLLDIGGSTGVVAIELSKAFSIKAAVLDPAADELDLANKYGLETIKGFLEQYHSEERHFDLVTLCQTIDHLTDAYGSLCKIHQLLAPNGLFFMDIVDFRASYLQQMNIEGAVKIDHPYYFTEDTAEAMMKRAGLAVLQKSYAKDHLHVGYICSRDEQKQEVLPSPFTVREFFREVRLIQNVKQ